MSDTQKTPIRFDENGELSPQDRDRLLSRLDGGMGRGARRSVGSG